MDTTRYPTNTPPFPRARNPFLPRTRFVLRCLPGILLFFAVLSCGKTFANHPILVDDFSEPIGRLEALDTDGTFPVRVGTTATGSMLGAERDVLLILDGVEKPGDGAFFEVRSGRVIFSRDSSSTGSALLIYDGVDGDPVVTPASTGLGGGIDLTQGGEMDGLDVDIVRNDQPLTIGFVFFSGLDDISEMALDVPVVNTPTTFRLPFSVLILNRGQGADLTRITTFIADVGALDSATGPAHIEIDAINTTHSQPPAGGPDVLYEQMDNLPSSAIWSVDFPGDNPFDAEAADDFVVPEGENWIIEGFEWAAEWIPSPPLNPTANLTIFENGPHVPGNILMAISALPIVPSDEEPDVWSFTLPEPWELLPGTYWISIQANVPVGFEMLWKERSGGVGNPYAWRNPGNAFGSFCDGWTDGISCLGNEPALAFRVLGPAVPVSDETNLVVTDMTHTPEFIRAGEPFTVGVTVENRSSQDQAADIDWYANLATSPGTSGIGELLDKVFFPPGESHHTLTGTFAYGEPGRYDTYLRVKADLDPDGTGRVYGPTQICVSSAEPVAYWFSVHETDDGLVVRDGRELILFDAAGQQIADVPTTAQPVVRTFGDRTVVIDGTVIKILDQNGSQIGSAISTMNVPAVYGRGERIIVVDGNSFKIYDKNGNLIAGPINTTNTPSVAATGNRIVIVDGSEVKLYDNNGNQIGSPITTQQPPEVTTSGNRILIVDSNKVTIYDEDGNQITPISTTHPPKVHTTGDRIIVIDGSEIRFYDNDGNSKGSPITTRNRPSVHPTTRRIVVVDGNEIRLYDKDGNSVGVRISTTNQPVIRTTGDRIVVVDGNEIKLYDESGNPVGDPITTASSPRIATAGDRIVVTENNQIRIYDKNGNPTGSPIITANTPVIRATDDRILVIDGNELNIYDTSGKRLSGPTMLNSRRAELMKSNIKFEPGEIEKTVWVPLSGRATILFESDAALSADAYDPLRNLIDGTGSAEGAVTRLRAETASDFFALTLSRPDRLSRTSQKVEAAVRLDDPFATFVEDSPGREFMINSPIRTFPGGTEIFELPEGSPYSFFDEFVEAEYGFSTQPGMLGLNWLVNDELLYVLYPPAGHAGALPPAGSNHDERYCGISTFIHSMETTFPGALKADVTTNSASWDEVGDNLDHSNWFGVRGEKMVININTNYGGNNPATQSGKSYCARQIRDTSPANLAAWAEDCDVKVLIYDFTSIFGHWADVVSVATDPADSTKATLNLQDYEDNYDVSFSSLASGDQIDFSGAPLDSVMRENFDEGDPIAGDDSVTVVLNPRPVPGVDEPEEIPTEEVWFYVVCERDPTTGGLPTSTKSGTTLNP